MNIKVEKEEKLQLLILMIGIHILWNGLKKDYIGMLMDKKEENLI